MKFNRIHYNRLFDLKEEITADLIFREAQIFFKDVEENKKVHRVNVQLYPTREYVYNLDSVEELIKEFFNFDEFNDYRFYKNDINSLREIVCYNDISLCSFEFDIQKDTNKLDNVIVSLISKEYSRIIKILEKLNSIGLTGFDYDKGKSTWYHFANARGEIIDKKMTIKKNKAFYPESYPWIEDPIQFMRDFKESDANVLVLLGSPGTGKTSFIKEMLLQNRWDSWCTYDEDVMSNDEFYVDFLKYNTSDVLILEDSDLLLEGRLDKGNKIMSKLLNVSDGMVSQPDKKFIFTANTKHVSDIDEALIRPGRCFGVIEFRPLAPNEINILSKAIGIDLPADRNATLSELFNRQLKPEQKSKFGF